jgi:hypothetical protein
MEHSKTITINLKCDIWKKYVAFSYLINYLGYFFYHIVKNIREWKEHSDSNQQDFVLFQ